jgi:hypothetical protein
VFGLSNQMQPESHDSDVNSKRTSGAKLRLFLESLAMGGWRSEIEFLVLKSYGLL